PRPGQRQQLQEPGQGVPAERERRGQHRSVHRAGPARGGDRPDHVHHGEHRQAHADGRDQGRQQRGRTGQGSGLVLVVVGDHPLRVQAREARELLRGIGLGTPLAAGSGIVLGAHRPTVARDAPAPGARTRPSAPTVDSPMGWARSRSAATSLDDVAVVPSRRTRDPEDVSTAWQVDAYHFDIPIFAAPMDSLMSPETAIALGRLGGLGVLDLEGLWTRYEDPTAQFARIAEASDEDVVDVMRSVYQEPIRPELIRDRLQQLRDAGVTAAGSLSPQRTQEHWRTVVDAGVDLFFIRGTTVSAEHVSSNREPLNLKRFIYELDVPVIVGGCATYTAALHLMRTGAAGVLVGFGGGASQTTEETLGISVPLAGAVADVAAARRDYMDESGGRYVHVIADGGLGRSGDLVKAI